MIKLRDVVIFFAGAVFMHTLSHAILPYYVHLPLNLNFMELSEGVNTSIVIVSALITIILLWWASRLPH